MNNKVKRKRLFLALWPDEITRKHLTQLQQQLARHRRLTKASAVAPEKFHITLHFLGAVDEEIQAQLVQALDNITGSAFSLEINRWGYLPRPRVLFLGTQDIPDALTDLVNNTASCVTACIENYRQKPFLPHLTLFRKAHHPKQLDEFDTIKWQVDRFVLVESITNQEGAEYKVLQEWRLAA